MALNRPGIVWLLQGWLLILFSVREYGFYNGADFWSWPDLYVHVQVCIFIYMKCHACTVVRNGSHWLLRMDVLVLQTLYWSYKKIWSQLWSVAQFWFLWALMQCSVIEVELSKSYMELGFRCFKQWSLLSVIFAGSHLYSLHNDKHVLGAGTQNLQAPE